MVASAKRIVKALGVGTTILLLFLLGWVLLDVWGALTEDRGSDAPELSAQPARALREAQARRVRGPETITVYVPVKGDVEIRYRHGVPPARPTHPAPIDHGDGTVPAEFEGGWLDMKDITITNDCGDTILEVGCFLFADGHGAISYVERPKTTPEKIADTAKDVGAAIKDTFWGRSAIEVGVTADPFDMTDWRGWAVWEPPLKIAHTRIRAGGEAVQIEDPADGGTKIELRPRVDVVVRFEMGRARGGS